MTDRMAKAGSPRRARASIVLPVIVVLLLVGFPFVTSSYLQGLAVVALLYAVVAASWDLTLGYAGVFNFAHLAFFGIGAYTAGILSVQAGIEPWLGLVAGVIAAVAASVVVYVPVSRLRGIYVALITFAFAQLTLRFAVSATDLTGGELGLAGVPPLRLGGVDLVGGSIWSFYFAAFLLVASVAVLRWFVRSDYGVSLVALKDAETYAISRGVSVSRARLLAFIFSAIFTGAAGATYTYYLQVISPGVLHFSLVTLVLSMVLVGGAGTLYGPVIAAVVLGIADELLAPIGPVRFVIVSALVLVTILSFPVGIWGGVRWARRRLAGGRSAGTNSSAGSIAHVQPASTAEPNGEGGDLADDSTSGG